MTSAPRHVLKYPQTLVRAGATYQPRLSLHYQSVLVHDLLYMHYRHFPRTSLSLCHSSDSADSYQAKRRRPPHPLSTAENVAKLDRVILHTMAKEAISEPRGLWPVAMQLKAISGELYRAGGRSSSQGVQFIRSSTGVAQFKIRTGLQIAAQVEMQGEHMWDFVGTFVDFVLPRLRDQRGITLPPASTSMTSAGATSGVVSIGLPAIAIGLFPQIDVNVDAYPKTHGLHVHFLTNARGAGAQARARSLLSGLRIPFRRT